MEIPNADKHRHVDKSGYLQKLCGRSFPYLHQWRRRYCVLSKGKLFFYEKDDSKGSDKSSGVIDLKYFDQIIEASPKEAKKATNVFVITSQDRSFFDPGRYLLSAETLTEMNEWILRLRESLEMIKNNNRPLRKEERKDHSFKDHGPKDHGTKDHSSIRRKENCRASQDSPDGKRLLPNSQLNEKKAEIESRLAASLASSQSQKESPSTKTSHSQKDEVKRVKLTEEASSPKVKLSEDTQTGQDAQSCSPVGESKPLESITKYRAKGPSGRRAPHSRRTVLMKQRASSLSALQQGNLTDDEIRPKEWEVGSKELLKEPCLDIQKVAINTSHPALAYRYSSDEESDGEQELLGVSALALYQRPPSPPPRTYSITDAILDIGEAELNIPVCSESDAALCNPDTVHLSEDVALRSGGSLFESSVLPHDSDIPVIESSSRRNSAILTHHCERPEDLLEYRSLPRCRGRISSGRSSPAMDLLENHLMNQSIQHIASPEGNLSDPESSEVSTYKGSQKQHYASSVENIEEVSNALISLSGALQHMQHHTAGLDSRTKTIENDLRAVVSLPSSADHLKKELNQLTETIAFISQEASRARIDLMSQRQETERIHHEANKALADAEKTRQELQKSKREYETLIKELHSLISSIKTTLEVTEPVPQPAINTQLKAEKPQEALEPSNKDKQNKQRSDKDKKEIEDRKSDTAKDSSKIVGYQSFFQRPSSLIYGLTSRSIGKAVSFTERDKRNKEKQTNEDKDKQNKNEVEEKKSKGKGSVDRKKKIEKRVSGAEKKSSAKKDDCNKKESSSQTKSIFTELPKEEKHKKLERSSALLSIDDLPMMDEHSSDTTLEKSNIAYGISHVSINVSPPISIPTRGFTIEKSPSSPVISEKGHKNRSRQLNIPLASNREINRSPSSSPSPDTARKKALSRRMDQKLGKSNQKREKRSTESINSNGKQINSDRTGSPRNSGIESRPSLTPRGIFAISRQSSSPNLPLQRQSSSSGYPIQRQLSLGTVPEEGLLPRQASLMSVPEDRPIVDQTLPLSPTNSMIFPISPSPSSSGINTRNSMELVTGPVISGSSYQEASQRQIPSSSEFHGAEIPLMTSSLKKEVIKKRTLPVVV